MKRKSFPTDGIYRVVGGICQTYYMNEFDALRFRYVRPASYVQPDSTIGDCWIVDKRGRLNPGTKHNPVPFHRSVIGRRIRQVGRSVPAEPLPSASI